MNNIAFVFPGQGSQYIGMGKKLHDTYPFVREIFEEANDILGHDMKSLCFDGDINRLTISENVQPAILVVSYANFRVFTAEYGIEPSLLAGHSLGEISALVCAGVIKLSDALRIVKVRARLMQEAAAGQGYMTAIMGLDAKSILEECTRISHSRHIVNIANYNSADQIIISGHRAAVDEAVEKLQQKGGRIMQINVNYPFHSPLMEPVLQAMEQELSKYDYMPFKYPVLSNVTALPFDNEESVISFLTQQIVKPVRWQESFEYMVQQGIRVAIDIGPQAILRNLMLLNDFDMEVLAYEDKRDGELIASVAEAEDKAVGIDRSLKYKLISKCLAVAVSAENRNWDNDAYEKGVVLPYRDIHNMLENLEKTGTEPLYRHMKASLDMLRTVFETKKVTREEQEDSFKQVLYETGLFDLFPDFLIEM